MKDVEELEGISRISEEFLFQMSRRKHRTVCTRRPLSTMLTAACFIPGTDFTAAYLLPMPTNPGFVFIRPLPSRLKPDPPSRQKPPLAGCRFYRLNSLVGAF